MDVRQEIPVKSFSISAYVCRVVSGRGRYLVIRRSTPHLRDTWQMVSGAVEAGETGWGAALREIEEETGLVPDRFYSADVLERFYRPDIDCVVLVPVFVGFLDADREVRLSREHDAFQWIGAEEADRYLLFENQRSAIRHIERRFVREEPTELLRIDTGRTKRTRRGKLRKAREGKVVGTHAARYGFKFNATKDAYEVHEAEMRVVRRIFEMIGAEGKFLRSVANKLEREGVPTPKRAKHWNRSFFRACIRDDVYRPHTREEVEAVVTPEVAARLDPDDSFGLWWFNRLGHKVRQVSEPSANGRRYRKVHDWYQKPKEEWIAVPVPDSGIPREMIEAARAAIEGNHRPARAGRRFWELTGGIARCGDCGWAMCATHSASTKRGRTYAYDYYRYSNRDRHGIEACGNFHKPRADKLEPEVWGFVSNLLKTPDLLRAGLEGLIEEERRAARGNPNREAEVWAKKLSEAERKRSAYQDQQAEGLITLDELRSKLAALEEARETARRELAAVEERRERIKLLEQEANGLLAHYAGIVPEALDALTPEERHRVYRMMRLNVVMSADGLAKVTGAFGGLLDAPGNVSVKSVGTSSSTATSRTSRRRVTGRRTASR